MRGKQLKTEMQRYFKDFDVNRFLYTDISNVIAVFIMLIFKDVDDCVRFYPSFLKSSTIFHSKQGI